MLGSVVIGQKQTPKGLSIDALTITAIVGLAASYLAMGLAAARIEVSMAKQCNRWRDLSVLTIILRLTFAVTP